MDSIALIVAAAPHALEPGMVSELAAQASVVVGVDGGAAVCLRAGVVPTVVVGDLDSLSRADARTLRAAGSAFEVCSADKDMTDLDLALSYVTVRSIEHVVVTGCTSGRLDHTLAAVGTLARAPHLRPRLVDSDLEAWILSADHADELALSQAGSTFSVLALLGGATVSVAGGKWPLVRENLRPLDSLGVSNVVSPGGAVVSVHSGTVAVLLNRRV